jgi:hypothetical protein
VEAFDITTFVRISNKLTSDLVTAEVKVVRSVVRCATDGVTGICFPAGVLGFRSSSIRVVWHNAIGPVYPEGAWSEFSCSVTCYPYGGSIADTQDTNPITVHDLLLKQFDAMQPKLDLRIQHSYAQSFRLSYVESQSDGCLYLSRNGARNALSFASTSLVCLNVVMYGDHLIVCWYGDYIPLWPRAGLHLTLMVWAGSWRWLYVCISTQVR